MLLRKVRLRVRASFLLFTSTNGKSPTLDKFLLRLNLKEPQAHSKPPGHPGCVSWRESVIELDVCENKTTSPVCAYPGCESRVRGCGPDTERAGAGGRDGPGRHGTRERGASDGPGQADLLVKQRKPGRHFEVNELSGATHVLCNNKLVLGPPLCLIVTCDTEDTEQCFPEVMVRPRGLRHRPRVPSELQDPGETGGTRSRELDPRAQGWVLV